MYVRYFVKSEKKLLDTWYTRGP